MAKKSVARSASKTLKQAAKAGSKRVTSVAGEALGAAAAAATGVVLREFADALGAGVNRNQNGDSPEVGNRNALSVKASKAKKRSQKSLKVTRVTKKRSTKVRAKKARKKSPR